jgi:hypothetical protein
MLLFVAFGFTCFAAGRGVLVTPLAMVTASGALAGTTFGCSLTIALAGASCRDCSDIKLAASVRHAANALMLTLRTSLRRA